MHDPGIVWAEAQSCGPFHGHQGSKCLRLLFFLGKQLIGCGAALQAVEIQVHQARAAALVVLGQRKGGAGDRLVDGQCCGNSLNKAGFAGAKIAFEQEDWL